MTEGFAELLFCILSPKGDEQKLSYSSYTVPAYLRCDVVGLGMH